MQCTHSISTLSGVKACRLLGKMYADSFSRVSAMGDFGEVLSSVTKAVLAQDKLSRDICPVPCSTLISHHCQVCVCAHVPAEACCRQVHT